MPLDGITSKCLAAELDRALAGARLDRIAQPDRFDLVLHFRKDAATLRLLISANPSAPRLHFLSSNPENPPEAPAFCMLLRKHLGGARVIGVSTPEWERVFLLKLQVVDELGDKVEKTLVAELMGKQSNVVLVSAGGRILDALLHVDHSVSRVREVMPGRVYESVPTQGKPGAADVLAALDRGASPFAAADPSTTLEKMLLASVQGFSPPLCRDVCRRAGLEPAARSGETSPDGLAALAAALRTTLVRAVSGDFSPTVFFRAEDDEVPYDFHALLLTDSGFARPVPSVGEGLERHYAGRARRNAFEQAQGELLRAVEARLDKAVKKLGIHEADERACADRDRWKRLGDLILASVHAVPEGVATVSLPDYFQDGAPLVVVALDPTLSASRNAQRYFRKYAKERLKSEASQRLAEEDRREIAYLDALRQGVRSAADTIDLQALRLETAQLDAAANPARPAAPAKGKPRKEPKALPVRHFVTADGFDVWAGRSNLQNDQLTLKKAASNDLWFHVHQAPGTHVIVHAAGRPVPDSTLVEAATIAAWYSRATQSERKAEASEGAKTAVDYCPVKNVRKPPGAKPGMVIYDTYRTLYVTPKPPKEAD